MLLRAVLTVVMLTCGLAAAETTDVRAVYKRAETAFALGRFNDAAVLFEQAFELKQDPVILYDAAQAHRLAGNKQKALVLYQNYLRLFGERKNHDVVERRITELKAAIDAERAASTNPPTGLMNGKSEPPSESAPVPTVPATTEPAPPPPSLTPPPQPELVVTQPAPPKKKPLARRAWFWGVVGGSVVVVGAAVVLGVVLGGSGSPPAVTLGTVRAN